MASSRIDHETGIVTITTPGVGCSPGDRFVVAGSPAARSFGFGQTWPDWCMRLVDPLPPWRGSTSGTVNHELAERALLEQLLEQLCSGEVHESLVEAPAQAA